MINRLFHRPVLHTALSGQERRVGWLGVLYDLVYVAIVLELGAGLAAHPTWVGALEFFGLCIPIWHTWTSFAFFSNRFVVDDLAHRLIVFAQLFGICVLATMVPRVFEGQTMGFSVVYGLVRLTVALLYARAGWQEPRARDLGVRYGVGFTVGAALWLVAGLVPSPWTTLVWAGALGVDLGIPLSRAGRELVSRFPPDARHFVERYNTFTLVVLGAAFFQGVLAVAAEGGTGPVLGMLGLALLITGAVWWTGFDDAADVRIGETPLAPYVWIYTHMPLTAGLAALGVGLKALVLADPASVAAPTDRAILCGALALALASFGTIDLASERPHVEISDTMRAKVHVASGFLVLLLIPAGAAMPAWAFLSVVAAACVLQVALDLTMSPELDPSGVQPQRAPLPTPEERAPPRPSHTPGVRSLAMGAVRRGVPDEFRRDLYFHLMEGSWSRLFLYLLVLFLAGNTLFGALYLLDPSGVAGLQGATFLDAFSFSVQTVATIGYGAMHPISPYANVLVAIEAFISIILVALVTGLVFAKASRPRGSVLFSAPLCVTTRNGVPTLTFRCANARGNELVEATVRLSALEDDVTPEGHRLRKLVDLPLERSMSPMFTLTWSVFHPLDEDSPLFGLNETHCDEQLITLIVTLTGHDSTYGQTVYARHLYFPEDFRWNARFVDVLDRMPDGRMVIDYDRFHDTTPDPGFGPAAEGASG